MVKLGKRLNKQYEVERAIKCIVCKGIIEIGQVSELTEVIRKRDSAIYWSDAHPNCLN